MFKKCFTIVFACIVSISSANTCDLDIKMKQTLVGDGYHREIVYNILFNGDIIDKSVQQKGCMAGLEQILPAGVYVNPDELGDLWRAKKLIAVPKTRINTELPTELAEATGVYIMKKFTGDSLDTWVPVHARYHQAVAGGGLAVNNIPGPSLHLRCPGERLRRCGKSSPRGYLCNDTSQDCPWRQVPYTLVSQGVVWEVPRGDTTHYHVVALGTTIVIVAGSLYLIKTVHDFKMRDYKKRNKKNN